VTFKPPKPQRYKGDRLKPTPEQEAILRRWREEADRRARERLKKLYGDT
jgi:hypothetical protein